MPTVRPSEVCEAQFEIASQIDTRFVHALDADDYWFGAVRGHGTLSVLPPSLGQVTILDIGAGYGTYLNEVSRKSERDIRAIGLTAVNNQYLRTGGIQWVFGDFLRSNTWEPADILKPESVDLAVSALTFQHFADPLIGLQNAFKLLKPAGHLLIDRLNVMLDPSTSQAASKVIQATLDSNKGELGFRTEVQDDAELPLHSISVFGLHIQKRSDIDFRCLRATGERNGKLVFTHV